MFLCAESAIGLPSAPDCVHLQTYYRTRIAFVQTDGLLFNGTSDPGHGSGLLVGDSYVITDSHVIPRIADYKSLSITVRLASRKADPVSAVLVERDSIADLALLKLDKPQPAAAPCPLETYSSAASTPMGTHLIMLGYPLNQPLSITEGLRSADDDDQRLWQTGINMNLGDSGGPVFNESGYIVGFSVSGIRWVDRGEGPELVEGINFFTPVATLLKSHLFTLIQAPPECWKVSDAAPEVAVAAAAPVAIAPMAAAMPAPAPAPMPAPAITPAPAVELAPRPEVMLEPRDAEPASAPPANPGGKMPDLSAAIAAELAARTQAVAAYDERFRAVRASEAVAIARFTARHRPRPVPADTPTTPILPDEVLPDQFNRNISLSIVQDDHGSILPTSRNHAEPTYHPEAGYRIAACEFHDSSASRAEAVTCTVAPDGKSADFQLTLRSGPFFDQWRGWWKGTVTLLEQRSP